MNDQGSVYSQASTNEERYKEIICVVCQQEAAKIFVCCI